MDTITVRCPSCENKLRVGADKAGRRAKCPKCGKAVPIPAAEEPPPVVAAAPPPPPPDDDDGPADYGLVDHDSAPPPEVDLTGSLSPKKKDKKKAAKITRRTKTLPDKEQWEKVNTGLLFVFMGVTVWLAAHLLHGLYVVLGNVDFPEFAKILIGELERPPADKLNMLIGMISGSGFLRFARGTMIVCFVLMIVQSLLWFVGYGFCFAVPNRYGTSTAISFTTATGVINFLNTIFLRLLPTVGAYNLILIPLLVPEISMTEFNTERSLPINVLWSPMPFWENFATVVVEFLMYLEPVLMAEFLWCVGMSLRDRRIEERARALVQLGLGQFFILVAYHMMAVCGTSAVLVIVLKVLYVLWYCFSLLFIAWLAGLLLKTREVLTQKIAFGGSGESGGRGKDEDEDEDE